MDGKKIFFLIMIVLIALVFIGGTVVGATRSGNGGSLKFDPTQIASQLGSLQQGLARPPAVATNAVRVDAAASTSADCIRLQGDLLTPLNQTCAFSILAVDPSFLSFSPATRRLALTLSEGDAAHLTWLGQVKQDNGNLVKVQVEKDLRTVETFTQDVYQPGGTLTVDCKPAVTSTGQGSSSSSLCRLQMGK